MSLPMTTQPGYQPVPTKNHPHGPAGLEQLAGIDQLLVSQKKELFEVFTGFERNNKYAILDGRGQQLFFAKEDNDCCTRNMFGSLRDFEMSIFDTAQREVIHISRPLACASCCFPCCLQTMQVSAGGGGMVLGSIKQDWDLLLPKLRILNAQGDTVLRVDGPFCTMSCCGNVDFPVMNADGTAQVGNISKNWSGFAKEMFTDADNFGVKFPPDLAADVKATLLAATFLVDYMYFEMSSGSGGGASD